MSYKHAQVRNVRYLLKQSELTRDETRTKLLIYSFEPVVYCSGILMFLFWSTTSVLFVTSRVRVTV